MPKPSSIFASYSPPPNPPPSFLLLILYPFPLSLPSLLFLSVPSPSLPLLYLGFAAFIYIVGFVLLFTAAIMVSPVCCGTPNETNIMRNPQEIEEYDAGK